MSDILIRMEMPKTCADCHDADLPTAIAWLGAKCPWAHGIIDPGVYDLRHGRHPNCPLVELPEHGDLIDRDALCDGLVSNHPVVIYASNEPVVIPSSKEETE